MALIKPVRISFVLPDFGGGGAQRVLLTFAGGLDPTRFAPGVIVLNGQGPWKSKLAPDLPVRDLNIARVRSSLPAMVRALRAEEPDIVVSTMSYLNFAVLACKPLLGRDVHFFVREANTPWSVAKGFFGRNLARLAYAVLYRRAAGVISPSHLIARELSDDFCVRQDLISVLRNPVDEDALRDSVKKTRRHPGKGHRFVAVGRLVPQKGYDRLVRTIAEYETDCHVVIFGEGPERSNLELLIAETGLKDRFELRGFDPDPAPWVAGADALLLPSLWEGLPNVALEALALGTPVIAAPEAGAISEIATEARQGAIAIAHMGEEFAAQMKVAPIRKIPTPQSSKLPAIFKKVEAIRAFEQLLKS
jgi:glycosyltransferase involved in cell wall biosynthesis